MKVHGLSTREVIKLRAEYGSNTISEKKPNWILSYIKKLSGPVAWMLEISLILELVLGKQLEALVIGLLLLFNATISTLQERQSYQALSILKKHLTISIRTLRDGKWKMLPAAELVPGDCIYLRVGDLIPADIRLLEGSLLVDKSAITGESLPEEVSADGRAFAGTVVRRGEASARVEKIGTQTTYGKTAELVRLAATPGHLQKLVFSIVRNLIILDIALITVVMIYAMITGLPMSDMVPFALILLVASIPIALPVTFTLATALGARSLTTKGVLVTRLSAIEDAAEMEVLCTDKTGTLTENKLSVATIQAMTPFTQQDVIRYAAFASDPATHDPLDMAIYAEAKLRHIDLTGWQRTAYTPFDPLTKRSEAWVMAGQRKINIMKGAARAINSMLAGHVKEGLDDQPLSRQGYRVLGVAANTGKDLSPVGLIAFEDPLRHDSASLLERLKEMGIRLIMITGDGLATAQTVARKVGFSGKGCTPETAGSSLKMGLSDCNVVAEVLPEDKFKLVSAIQKTGLTVGMTGDGVNDAPALKQAEVGIAVANATDVAKAAASLVLTKPGLSNVVDAIQTSREIYQRMLTYTLNKIIKTIEIAFFLGFGLMLTDTFVTTPLLMILLLFTNDFVTMMIATDNVKASQKPNRWQVRTLVIAALFIAMPILLLSFGVFLFGRDVLHLPLAELQTLIFAMLVFSGQGTIYLVRERNHFWSSCPSRSLIISSLTDMTVVILIVTLGYLVTPIPLVYTLIMLGIIIVYLALVDLIKVQVFQILKVR
jgi:H+-transporting ATPase